MSSLTQPSIEQKSLLYWSFGIDNGPNKGFGAMATGCEEGEQTDGDGEYEKDKLNVSSFPGQFDIDTILTTHSHTPGPTSLAISFPSSWRRESGTVTPTMQEHSMTMTQSSVSGVQPQNLVGVDTLHHS